MAVTISCYSVFIGFETKQRKKETFKRFVWAENKQEAFQVVLSVAQKEKYWGKVNYRDISKSDFD